MAERTIAFVDLTGSVSVYEMLGNHRAAQVITQLVQWIGVTGQQHGGQLVKTLGDGVLLSFLDNRRAVEAVMTIQRQHAQRQAQWPEGLRPLMMQIGMAHGPVVEVDGDCFGDAVNIASRLSDLAGPEQILVTDTVIGQLGPGSGVRNRRLGPLRIKGRAEPCEVFRIEWQMELPSDFLTLPADLNPPARPVAPSFGGIELAWLDARRLFRPGDVPISMGRVPEARFVVNDPRVSRIHAHIDLRSGQFVLQDSSSYGTWVRFAGTPNVIALRRQDCVLHSDGEIAMGTPFTDFSAPTVSFRLLPGSMAPGRGGAPVF